MYFVEDEYRFYKCSLFFVSPSNKNAPKFHVSFLLHEQHADINWCTSFRLDFVVFYDCFTLLSSFSFTNDHFVITLNIFKFSLKLDIVFCMFCFF